MALKVSLRINLSQPGDEAVIEADDLTQVHTALQYLSSIGALRQPAQVVSASVDTTEPLTPGVPTTNPEPVVTAGPTEEPKAETPKAETPKPEKPKREPKPKAEKADKKADGPKQEEVTAAITDLANATSLLDARKVLEAFGVKRAAELKPEQYAGFIEAARAAMPDGEAADDETSLL